MDYQATLPRLIQFGDTAASIPAALVTGNFFDVLGARPVLGRLLRPDDDLHGAPFAAVISERLWRSAYGADLNVVGTTTKFYLRPMTIVGVVADGLDFPRGAELWASAPNYFGAGDTLPGFFDVVARLAPGRTVSDARGELGAFLARDDAPHSSARRLVGQSLRPTAKPILDVLVGDVRPVFRVVLAAVALLLLVTCVNVAGLVLVRALARRREFAVRTALGAGWPRITRQTLSESILLSLMGGTLGIACSWFAVRLFTSFAPPTFPRAHEIAVSVPVLAGAIAISFGAAIIFGIIPAAIAARLSLTQTLAERRDGGTGPRAHRARAALVAAQVAAAITVLAAASMVAASFARLARSDLGFQPEGLIIARFGQGQTVGDAQAWRDVAGRVVDRLRQVRGVSHATALLVTPFRATGNDLAYSLPGDGPGATTNRPMADFLGADGDYFATLGIPLRQGRTFTNDDGAGAARVAVVDEILARQAWPGKDAIGRQIGVGTTMFRVVGVVAATRYRDLLAPRATLYVPFAQEPGFQQQYVAIRTTGDPPGVIGAVRNATRETDSRLYLADFATMSARIDTSLTTQRISAALLVSFAAAILILTGVGLYSVAATFVRQREFEIGVRMALGATPRQVAWLVVGQGIALVGAGTAAGLVGALIFGRVVDSLAYVQGAHDAIQLTSAIGAVCVVAAAAFSMPARRAANANPADILRGG